MFCPKCGRMNPDENETCKGCGAMLHDPVEENKNKAKKPSSAKKLAALAVALLVAAGAVAIGVTSCQSEADASFYCVEVF